MLADGNVLVCDGYANDIRWRPGERLHDLFERRCDELGDALAVDGPEGRATYRQLDARANRLARFLSVRGVGTGDRVGLLLDRPLDRYAGMLAVLKLGAAYVPLDAAFPADRLSYIAGDAELVLVVTESDLDSRLTDLNAVEVVHLDESEKEIAAGSGERFPAAGRKQDDDDLCYVIYTSGTTGRPKGVAVRHSSICNFVRVAGEVYGVRPDDRVYQGLTIAFDFAVEEIWVAWMAGATLVPAPAGGKLVGAGLEEFLKEQRVTALCCVPTLLATLEGELADIRFLLVSGESCPADLVARWSRAGRRFLNVYGPTEATVSATWTVLDPARPVTIGRPLPTYSVVILDPDEDRALPAGEAGEIGIAGIGVADGYLNDPERTRRAFVPDFLSIPGNRSGRIYRTGDLGRVNADGEVELHGRIDSQVKIRGYRIELEEIEAVLRQVPGVGEAAVGTYRPLAGAEELVAYYCQASGSNGDTGEHAYAVLREKLPDYMVPAYLERLEELPLMVSGKVDRRKLPAPTGGRRVGRPEDYVAPSSQIEAALAEQLAEVLDLDRVSVEGHFFDDLGASSLLMALFISELSKRADVPAVSIRDVYLHPTVRELAEAIGEGRPDRDAEGAPEISDPVLPEPTGTPRYRLCGALQMLTFLAYACAAALAFDAFASWLTAASGALELYARAVVVGAATLLGLGLLPVAVKWLLIGRFKPGRIRVWSLPYLRFWIVKTLLVFNPLARLLVGTPLYNLYLRALGAKVGEGALILTRYPPVCTDLLTIGAGSVVRKDTYLNGYRARGGAIETGAITIGDNVLVGERSMVEIGTQIGDGAQLGHASCLQAGQAVPARACWHGTPARPADPGYDYRTVPAAPCGRLRRATFGAGRLLSLLAIVGPLEAVVAIALLTHQGFLGGLPAAYSPLVGLGLVFGLIIVSVIVAGTVPRLLSRWLDPGRVYPLYGLHHSLQGIVSRTSNVPPLTHLFGDSSAITGYLRWIGYRLGVVEQTGSNFGVQVKHEVPSLCTVGTGTMASDPLSMMNAEFSSSSFRVMPVAVGERSYLGNDVVVPAGARTGENCLLATKAMVPIAGPVRENVGLLGSPSFEIPRSVVAPEELRRLGTGEERRKRLAGKNRHNSGTAGLFVLLMVLYASALVLIAVAPLGSGALGTTGSMVLDLGVIPLALFVLAERIYVALRPLRPRTCSIYQPDFWRHERYWKVSSFLQARVFDGTPFKTLVWRLRGVRIGRRVFDDGSIMPERSLVTIGDETTLNMGAVLQGHSLEEGVFRSDRIRIGRRCTVGTGALVHYGVVMEDGSLLEADSFLMKGSRLGEDARWRGNPAVEV